ncbi:hypothetical protein [Thalassotalea euphylliae]|uniref:Uncharacterized protein n=1 Tax=Thalassotalea euphylliae TaxID=1655234 RepID=A0A3E0UJD5_9GAMM|nr:hypothetical protein [Thalassotalea euphylliae]REL36733.1 hypothetical protein DXX92_16205 [Thalassotalea euphylliae]
MVKHLFIAALLMCYCTIVYKAVAFEHSQQTHQGLVTQQSAPNPSSGSLFVEPSLIDSGSPETSAQQTIQETPKSQRTFNTEVSWLQHNEIFAAQALQAVTNNKGSVESEPNIATDAQFLSPAITQYSLMQFSTQPLALTPQTAELAKDNAYLQTSYVVASYQALDIALSAKIEQLDTTVATSFYGPVPNLFETQNLIGTDITSATFGIIGNYQLTPNWSIVGAITATSVAEDTKLSTLDADALAHMALIGASYSF